MSDIAGPRFWAGEVSQKTPLVVDLSGRELNVTQCAFAALRTSDTGARYASTKLTVAVKGMPEEGEKAKYYTLCNLKEGESVKLNLNFFPGDGAVKFKAVGPNVLHLTGVMSPHEIAVDSSSEEEEDDDDEEEDDEEEEEDDEEEVGQEGGGSSEQEGGERNEIGRKDSSDLLGNDFPWASTREGGDSVSDLGTEKGKGSLEVSNSVAANPSAPSLSQTSVKGISIATANISQMKASFNRWRSSLEDSIHETVTGPSDIDETSKLSSAVGGSVGSIKRKRSLSEDNPTKERGGTVSGKRDAFGGASNGASVKSSDRPNKPAKKARPGSFDTSTDVDSSPVSTSAWKIVSEGLQYKELEVGVGRMAALGKRVRVVYEGKILSTGKVFEKNESGFKFTVGSDSVIKGWNIGVFGMKVGGKRILRIPANLAYGTTGYANIIPPNSSLEFSVKLLSVRNNKGGLV